MQCRQLATGHWCVTNVPLTLKLAVRDLIGLLECDKEKFAPVTFQVLLLQYSQFPQAFLHIKIYILKKI